MLMLFPSSPGPLSLSLCATCSFFEAWLFTYVLFFFGPQLRRTRRKVLFF